MSELVERQIMESTTEEIEKMKSTKLFSFEETRAILKKRKQFAYKINGVTKNLQDFKDFIQYEKILLKNIKVRRNKYRITDGKNNIEFTILKRIKYLYEIASQKFSYDFSLCLAYFKFCKESNYNRAASILIQNMTKNFPQNPEVWKVASAWYIQRDLNEALNVILKGLMIHKDCQTLYTDAIQLELLNGDKDDCEKLKTYVQSIFENITDFRYLLEILKLLEQYGYTRSVQNMIIDRLIESHSDEEIVWDTLAQRERNGFNYEFTDARSISQKAQFCLNKCLQRYQEGLSKVSESKKSSLWTLYLDCLMELRQQSDIANIIEKETLITALEEASKQISLDEEYFIVWVQLVDNELEAHKILEKAITALPHSVELWKLKLKYAIMRDDVKEVNKIFKGATIVLKEKSLPIWLTILRFHTLTSNNGIIESIYKDGVKQPKEISDILKPEYIQWVSLVKDIKETRKAYNLLALQKPYCKELHTAMYKIESLENNQDVDEMENVLKLACEQFGNEDVDVWINYVEFYLYNYKLFEKKNSWKNSPFKVEEKILEVYRKAEYTLKSCNNGMLLSNLKKKFESVKNSINT